MYNPKYALLVVSSLVIVLTIGATSLLHPTPVDAETDSNTIILLPTAPVISTASWSDDQVTITWHPSQPGSFDLLHYRLSRSDDGKNFNEIAIVDKNATSYIDTEGHEGQYYSLSADDNSQPANRSAESEAVSVTPKPPDTIQPEPTTPSNTAPSQNPDAVDVPPNTAAQDIVINDVSALEKNLALNPLMSPGQITDQTINHLNASGDLRVAQIQRAVNSNHAVLAQPLLDRFSYEKQNLYRQISHLAPSSQQAASSSCDAQTRLLETILITIPENNQLDALTALASCQLITGN